MERAKRVQIDENILFMRSLGKPQKGEGLKSSRGESSVIGECNEEGFWDYLAGLFEGDGSIYGKEGTNPGVQITFNKKDLPLVKELATKLGGKIN